MLMGVESVVGVVDSSPRKNKDPASKLFPFFVLLRTIRYRTNYPFHPESVPAMLRSASSPPKSFEVTLSHHSFFYDKKLLAVIKKAQQGTLNSISDVMVFLNLTWPSALRQALGTSKKWRSIRPSDLYL